MQSRFLIFLGLGLAVVGALIFTLFTASTGAHLRLEGKILKVRTLQLTGSAATLVILDVRATNPSDVPFVISSVSLILTPAQGEEQTGLTIPKADVENIFNYQKLLGPRYNPVLSIQDRIAPHRSLDFMAGARFDVPEATVNARKGIRIRLEDVDGPVAELTE